MRQSELFTKTRREAPADETSKNAQLLIRAGYIHKEMAGVYTYLPLGLRVFKNIEQIIREEMDAIGGQELLMTTLQEKDIWEKTDRWSDEKVDVWFKTSLKNGTELGLANTHEEAIANMVRMHVRSYKDLPFFAYQFQTKFRNETRAKSGIMRTREFVMKDLYSFHTSVSDLDSFYEKVASAYHKIFQRVGLGENTFQTFASGGAFSKYSHEFQTICEAGEDLVYIHKDKKIAINKEVYNDEVLNDLGISKDDLLEKKAIEVGNIFKLGTRFSEPLGLNFVAENGSQEPVVMGSYGIGPGRVMGTVVESFCDDKGIVWPKEVAPFSLHILEIPSENPKVKELSEKIYKEVGENISLYDDRSARAGEKFADADLIGIPYQVIVSEKNLESGKLEFKNRKTGEVRMVSEEELLKLI